MDILNILLNCQKDFKEAKQVGNHNELFKELSKLSLENSEKIKMQETNKDEVVFEIIDYDVLYMSNNDEISKFFKSSIANKLTLLLDLRSEYISYNDIKDRIIENDKKGFNVEISEDRYRSIKTGSSFKMQRIKSKGVTVYTFVVLINSFDGCVKFKKDNNNYKRLKQSKNCKLDIDISID